MTDIQGLRDWLRSLAANWFERPMVSAFAAVGISANVATLIGVAIAGVAAYFAAVGDFRIAGILVIVGSAMDLIDGGLARRAGTVTKRGAILDSVVDRVSETLVFVGLIIYYTDPDTASQTCLSRGPECRNKAFDSRSSSGPGIRCPWKTTSPAAATTAVSSSSASLCPNA